MKLNCADQLNPNALERRFWLLVGEYDRLLEALASAIELKDFDLVLSIQVRQDSILKAIMAHEALLDHTPQSHEALQALTQKQRLQHEGLGFLLKDVRSEIQKLNRKAITSQQVSKAYSKSFEVF